MRPGVVQVYQPGVCNIGTRARRVRSRLGWFGTCVALGVAAGIVARGAPRRWRLAVFPPAMVGAIGFVQAKKGFCAGLGMMGVSDFSDAGSAVRVVTDGDRRLDRRKAVELGFAAGLWSAGGTAMVWWVG